MVTTYSWNHFIFYQGFYISFVGGSPPYTVIHLTRLSNRRLFENCTIHDWHCHSTAMETKIDKSHPKTYFNQTFLYASKLSKRCQSRSEQNQCSLFKGVVLQLWKLSLHSMPICLFSKLLGVLCRDCSVLPVIFWFQNAVSCNPN